MRPLVGCMGRPMLTGFDPQRPEAIGQLTVLYGYQQKTIPTHIPTKPTVYDTIVYTGKQTQANTHQTQNDKKKTYINPYN